MSRSDKRIINQWNKKEEIDNEFKNTNKKIMETVKNRQKTEKSYLDIIKKQKKYWEDQLKKIDPEINKNRYNELNENIEREKRLIKQIKEELDRIDKEFKMVKEYQKKSL